ncbi:alpha 1,2-mannosyltransferase 2.4.1 [Saxophila tyrrhenica]|uniref:Alpha 1,2-mannosyltransferase 2.4.1 n=1 Tax=Saxophila tyrrhenica TaxID=1690608 RepID=A0AAV9NZQ7_9PEZI|nr:alpha 1,2-mannosyltransferase 2.4.1 [Saxophila tyrrhenica]
MAGSTRYIRYILLAFVTLVVIFFISSSSSTVDDRVKSATDLLKKQGSLFKGHSPSSDSTSPSPPKPPPRFHSDEEHDTSGQVLGNPPSLSEESPPEPMPSGHSNATSPNPSSQKLGTNKQPFTHNPVAPGERMNATFVTLARNSDVWEISRSIRQVEDRFNRNYGYDWVFLNDDEFDDTFKKVTTTLTSGRARYGKIGEDHWGFPSWIDQEKAATVREEMREKKIIYGDSISYRHMCRYESGFFFRHPLMMEYEYYWRVEPSIELFCDVSYDPFKYMAENNKKYSFVLSLYEYRETIPTLWDSVKNFTQSFPQHIAKDNALWWISEDEGKNYNNCHFWSNFEIGSLEWLRSDAYIDYFTHLDKDGGFFYERWGDAPVHSIAAALMLPKDEIHFFNDIAYYHVPFTHCPTGEQTRLDLKCHCDPSHNFDWNGYSCLARWYDMNDWEKPEGWQDEQ